MILYPSIERKIILETKGNDLVRLLDKLFRQIEQHDLLVKYIFCGMDEISHLRKELGRDFLDEDSATEFYIWTAKVIPKFWMKGLKIMDFYFNWTPIVL